MGPFTLWWSGGMVPLSTNQLGHTASESTSRLTMRRANLRKNGGRRRWANARQWLQHRREAVRKAVESGSKVDTPIAKIEISKMARKMWTERHQKETEFTRKKEKNRRPLLDFIVKVCLGQGYILIITNWFMGKQCGPRYGSLEARPHREQQEIAGRSSFSRWIKPEETKSLHVEPQTAWPVTLKDQLIFWIFVCPTHGNICKS